MYLRQQNKCYPTTPPKVSDCQKNCSYFTRNNISFINTFLLQGVIEVIFYRTLSHFFNDSDQWNFFPVLTVFCCIQTDNMQQHLPFSLFHLPSIFMS